MMPAEPQERSAGRVRGGRLVVVAGLLLGIVGTSGLAAALVAGSVDGGPVRVALASRTPSPAAPSPEPPGPSATPSPTPAPTASPSPTPKPTPDLPAILQRRLDAQLAKYSLPGVSAAIIWPDGTTWTGAAGMADEKAGTPMTTDTAFGLASISKTFTAAVVMQLVQEGTLSLDEPVAPLLPDFTLDPAITVRNLLDHTSGLTDYFLNPKIDSALLAKPNAAWTAARAMGYVIPDPALLPDLSWSYSNANYLLLGELVAAVTGHPLADEIRTRLLVPLALEHTWYQSVEDPAAAEAMGYTMAKSGDTWTHTAVPGGKGVMPFRSVVTAAGGAGSMAATALDTARWIRAWATGQVLDAATMAEVTGDVDRTVALGATIPYGLGIQAVPLGTHPALGHSGRLLGFRSVARYLTTSGITIVVLTNQSYWDPARVANVLADTLLAPEGTEVPSPTPAASGDASASPGASATPSPGASEELPSVLPDG